MREKSSTKHLPLSGGPVFRRFVSGADDHAARKPLFGQSENPLPAGPLTPQGGGEGDRDAVLAAGTKVFVV